MALVSFPTIAGQIQPGPGSSHDPQVILIDTEKVYLFRGQDDGKASFRFLHDTTQCVHLNVQFNDLVAHIRNSVVIWADRTPE